MLLLIAVPITAKKGSESKYLPAKNNKIIAVTERIIIPNLNIPENVFLSILEISQRTPYKIRNIIKLKTIRFIYEISTQIKKRKKGDKSSR